MSSSASLPNIRSVPADLAAAVTEEMGAPNGLAGGFHIGLGLGHLTTAIDVLKTFKFEEQRGATLIVKEPIGVCGMITPWNWPINQIAVKVFPALATGCTMVLKPSEESPFSAQILAEILDAAGVPAGVFNLIHGDGSGVGAAMSSHPDIDMVSFTGSTRPASRSRRTRRRRSSACPRNWAARAPTSCSTTRPSPRTSPSGVTGDDGQLRTDLQRHLAHAGAEGAHGRSHRGRPRGRRSGNRGRPQRRLSPSARWSRRRSSTRSRSLIQKGIDEGATLVAGGPGRPDGLRKRLLREAHRLRQRHQRHDHRPRGDLRAGAVHPRLRRCRSRGRDRQRHGLRPGRLCLGRGPREGPRGGSPDPGGLGGASTTRFDFNAPFGGYKRSGNGREWGEFGFHEYLEIKGILGYAP